MSPKHASSIVVALGAVAALVTAEACVQFLSIAPPRQKLPADLFRLHVHIRPPPLEIAVPLMGGETARIEGPKAAPDPQAEFGAIIAAYEAEPQRLRSFAERNDYAASLVFSGRFNDAIPVLVQIEHDFPGEYATASNLGTAYELVGDVENATVWIRKGMERNPESHTGTEWLHLAILEAKRELKRNPYWLSTHSVLDGQEQRTRAEKENALEYQLNERLNFIRDNDPIMCDLFYQAALLTTEPAKRAYFLKQVPRFGSIRDNQLRKLRGG